jgi:hypothetical protein
MDRRDSRDTRRAPSTPRDLSLTHEVTDLAARLLYLPLNFLLTTVGYALGALRALSPQLVPIVACALFVPGLILASLSAGFVVWRTAAVGWETPVYLNYG